MTTLVDHFQKLMMFCRKFIGNGTAEEQHQQVQMKLILQMILKAFQAAQDAGAEGVETTSSINTTASLGVSMSAGDGWTASTSGTINLGGGSVSGGSLSLSNGMLTLSVGKSQHSAAAQQFQQYLVWTERLTQMLEIQTFQATMALGGATISVDNEMDGDNLGNI